MDLTGADLSGADFTDANLSGANLSGANLSAATGKTHVELEREARSLEHVIMPKGQRYEAWVTDNEDRKEDGENTGTS